jgi:pimeloyl-ACP methyl ester carboxylesterase
LLEALQSDELLSSHDRELLRKDVLGMNFVRTVQEGLRQAAEGPAWDNVAWIGPWGTELDDVGCPVHLWYGDEDRMASAADGQWLREHLPDAELTVYPGEGHLVVMSHSAEMLTNLRDRQPTHRS